jgi:hypothetical protein
VNLVNNFPRRVLFEGRSQGMGFAFAKLEGDTLTTVGPISPCKDYANDQVYAEAAGKPFSAYGYHAVKTGCFEGGKAYLVMAICKQGATAETIYPTYADELKLLDKNHPQIAALVNHFEERLKVEGRTEILPLPNHHYVVVAPAFWVSATYLISLLTLLLRAGLGFDGTLPVMEYLTTKVKDYSDQSYLKTALPKVELMVKNGIPKQDFTRAVSWHNEGIVNWKP